MASMRKKRKRGHDYVRFYDGDRPEGDRRCTRSLKTTRKDVAESRIVEKRRQFKAGDWNPWTDTGGPEPLSLSEAIDSFRDHKESTVTERTLGTYDQQLGAWADGCPTGIMLRDVQPDHIRRYVHASDVAQSTRRKRWRHVKAFLRWAVKAGQLDDSRNPLSEVEAPEKGKQTPAYLTPGQLERLLEYTRWHEENVEDAVGRSHRNWGG
jgi:integrase